MAILEAVLVKTLEGEHISAYTPVRSTVQGIGNTPATIETADAFYQFSAQDARILAQTIAPDLDPEQVKEDLLKPYQDKAAAALKEMTETVESWTRELIAARQSQWEGHQLADSMENLLLALSPVLVTLREIKDGDL